MQKNTTSQKNTNAKSNKAKTKGQKAPCVKAEIDSYIEKDKNIMANLDREAKKCGNKIFYERWIDNSDLSKGTKNALKEILDITQKIGSKVYSIGKITLNIAINVVKKLVETYPMTTMGMLLGLTLGYMMILIPFIGPYIGPTLAPLFAAVGASLGLILDVTKYILIKCEIIKLLRDEKLA